MTLCFLHLVKLIDIVTKKRDDPMTKDPFEEYMRGVYSYKFQDIIHLCLSVSPYIAITLVVEKKRLLTASITRHLKHSAI